MRCFQSPFTVEDLAPFAYEWINLLGNEQYEQALDCCYRGDINPFGLNPDYRDERWTSDLLRQVIHNYGLFDCERDDWSEAAYHVLPITDLNRFAVENSWSLDLIDVTASVAWGLDPAHYAGIVHIYLPMDYKHDPSEISDVCARFAVRRIDPTTIALELDTVHVL